MGNDEIDKEYGNNDNVLDQSDMNEFYGDIGLSRGYTNSSAEVMVYTDGGEITHSAKRRRDITVDGKIWYESKLGSLYRIIHEWDALDGVGPNGYGPPTWFYGE